MDGITTQVTKRVEVKKHFDSWKEMVEWMASNAPPEEVRSTYGSMRFTRSYGANKDKGNWDVTWSYTEYVDPVGNRQVSEASPL